MSTISPDHVNQGPAGTDPRALATRPGASELETVTGPLPVLDLEEGHLHVTSRRDVTIVAIDGGLDDELAGSLVDPLREVLADAGAVVVDLDRVTLLDRSALEQVCAVVEELPDCTPRCLVAGRLSGRMVLDRWDVPARFAVFGSVADALQAREFVSSGYGDGWDLAG